MGDVRLRVGIIIDNPKRDLSGAILLSKSLLDLGCEPVLVPMYFQEIDIFLLKPDVIIANYIRPTNIRLLKKYKKSGMKIVVSDTEGGVLSESGPGSPDGMARQLKSLKAEEVVDIYTFWGSRLKEAVSNLHFMDESRLLITGAPRMDVYNQNEIIGTDYILINTNFPLCSPAFNRDGEKEIKVLIRHGWTEKDARGLVSDVRKTKDNFIADIVKLVSAFPDREFVIRPHPFEDHLEYRGVFKEFSNVKVRMEGEVLRELQNAEYLIHVNCSTAIEAFFIKVPSISLKYAAVGRVRNNATVTMEVGFVADTFREVYEIIENRSRLNGRLRDEIFKKKIEPWFGLCDGHSSRRVSNAVCSLTHSLVKKKTLKLSEWLSDTAPGKKIYLYFQYILGTAFIQSIRSKLQINIEKKKLSADQLRSAIEKAALSGSVSVEHAVHPLTGVACSSWMVKSYS